MGGESFEKTGPRSPLASHLPFNDPTSYLPIGRRHDRIEASLRDGARGLQHVDNASSNAAVSVYVPDAL